MMPLMRQLGTIVLVASSVAIASAGEVHTRMAPGTWSSDPQRGTLRGTIANDGGYSFWLTAEQVSLATPVTVIAQVRFVNRVDYGGAGVALVDPTATNRMQKHIRIELSEREDTAGVGGWLGNENSYSGGSKRASKDIRVGEWYELAVKIDGTRAIGYLDGAVVFDADVPELRQLPQTVTIAPFVVEADVEVRVIVQRAAAAEAKQPDKTTAAKIGWIDPYGRDETDGSDVKWLSTVPRPSFVDDPEGGGKPNAEWDASYELKNDRVCVRVASLRAPKPSAHTLAVGYRVTLDGAIFDNGSRTKTIVVARFTGTPQQATAGTCETVVIGGTPTATESPPGPTVDPVDPYDEPAALPPTGKLGDLLPKTSKKQAEIEKLVAQKLTAASGPEDYRRLYGKLDELILAVGAYHFFLEPVSRQWHFYNRLHDAWEPTGFFAGEATFAVVRGKVKVTKKRKGRA